MSERDATEDALRDAAHDAFMAFWRSEACEQAAMWAAYCVAQVRYEACLGALATRDVSEWSGAVMRHSSVQPKRV